MVVNTTTLSLVDNVCELSIRAPLPLRNTSLQNSFLPHSQKQDGVTVHLKKLSLDPDDLNSFCAISDLISTPSTDLVNFVNILIPSFAVLADCMLQLAVSITLS